MSLLECCGTKVNRAKGEDSLRIMVMKSNSWYKVSERYTVTGQTPTEYKTSKGNIKKSDCEVIEK